MGMSLKFFYIIYFFFGFQSYAIGKVVDQKINDERIALHRLSQFFINEIGHKNYLFKDALIEGLKNADWKKVKDEYQSGNLTIKRIYKFKNSDVDYIFFKSNWLVGKSRFGHYIWVQENALSYKVVEERVILRAK